MKAPSIEARLGHLIPREAIRQVIAMLEEYQRRAKKGRWIPRFVSVTLELGEESGEVVEAEVPRRYPRE